MSETPAPEPASDPFDRNPAVAYGVAEEPVPGLPLVRRVTCRNPSPMTFTGTRSYLVGRGEVAVIDPGPMDAAHLGALTGALEPGERIGRVILTHTHVDHSAGARALAAAVGAPVLAFGPHGAGMSETMRRLAASGADLGGGEGADRALAPDVALADGEVVEGDDWALEVIHTPGHLSNHVSLALAGTGAVFTGDTVMGWATTLVSPPEGDMAALMGSLHRLRAREDRMFLPGHGHPVTDPAAMLDHQIAHREARAAAIRNALADGPATARELAGRIYTDVDPALLPAAARNVFATLIGELDAGRATVQGTLTPGARFRLR